jgi:peroxiredoxin
MSNALTGNYDVVLEITIDAIDRILATIHQKGDSGTPKFLHSATGRVGDASLTHFPVAEDFLLQNFGGKIADINSVPPATLQTLEKDLLGLQGQSAKVVQDVGGLLSSETAESIGSIVNAVFDVKLVRGTVQVQVGSPGLSVSAGSTNEITATASIRARYVPDPNTAALPSPIHGDVQAAFTLNYNPSGANGKPALEAQPTTDKNKISFTAAPGSLTAAEAAQITRQVQKFVMKKFAPIGTPLPDGFQFTQFKGLSSGSTRVVALPAKLTGNPLPASNLSGINNVFLGSGDDFAAAVSKDYIDTTIFQPILNQLQTIGWSEDVTILFHWVSISASVTGASVSWQPGIISLVISAHLHIWKAIGSNEDYDFTVTQNLTLTLESSDIRVERVGDIVIQGLPQDYVDKATPSLQSARDSAMNALQPIPLSSIPIGKALNPFGADAYFKKVDIAADGVILRGKAVISPRPAPIVDYTESSDHKSLTAFKSWIPGGVINDFVWSWLVPTGIFPWNRALKQLTQKHSFVFDWSPKKVPGQFPPPPPWSVFNLCLTIDGSQAATSSTIGGPISASSSGSCSTGQPEWMDIEPAWWANLLMIPVWGPDPGPESVLETGIIAQINVRPAAVNAADVNATAAQSTRKHTRSTALIHFAGAASSPLSILSDAVDRSSHRQSAIPIFVVLPAGTFRQRRSVVEAQLGKFSADLSLPLVITEDYEGGWSSAFPATGAAGAGGIPATYLLGPDGQIAWQHQGAVDSATLKGALDQFVVPAAIQRPRLARCALRVGSPIPDFIFDVPGGKNLRGKSLLLTFYKSWSTPCLNQLRLLQQIHQGTAGHGPAIVAIADGEAQKQVDDAVHQNGLDILIVPDPNRSFARRCGINCWPTTIIVRQDGLIGSINFGAGRPQSSAVAAA